MYRHNLSCFYICIYIYTQTHTAKCQTFLINMQGGNAQRRRVENHME